MYHGSVPARTERHWRPAEAPPGGHDHDPADDRLAWPPEAAHITRMGPRGALPGAPSGW
jgi:hypothetical protein